jgi:hypothetical protein
MMVKRLVKWKGLSIIITLLLCSAAFCERAAEADEKSLPRATRAEDRRILISTDCLKAEIWPTGYVSGIKAGTFVDRKTGARDHSFGLDIVDFLMGPGAEGGIPYKFDNTGRGI